jgi:hypothetical protein
LPYIEKIKADNYYEFIIPKNVATSTIEDVAIIEVEKKSFFNKFLKEKKDGIIRIGAFGDSNTYGLEVDYKSDFPSVLGEIFKNYGCDNVEVLNFGVSGHGGHQSIRIWELEGREYDLDFILFGPEGFQIERDLVFNWTRMAGTYNIHGRYIIKKNKEVEFISPLGGSDLNKRFNNYYSFIPKLRYLLYDRNPPVIIKSLLEEGKTIDNPFYYYEDGFEKEYHEIYDVLLKRVSDEIKQIVFLKSKRLDIFPELKENISNMNINIFSDVYDKNFYAPNGHHGAIFYNSMSQVYFDLLTGAEKQKIVYLKSHFNEINNIEKEDSVYFKDISDITIDFDDIIVSSFMVNNREDKNGNKYPVFLEEIYGNKEIKSFITVKGNNQNIWSSLFLPLDFDIKDDMELKFVYHLSNGEEKEKKIGKIGSIDNSIGFINVDFAVEETISGVSNKTRNGNMYIKNIINRKEFNEIKEGFIYLGDERIYFGEKRKKNGGNDFIFFPVKYDHYLFRQNSNPPTLMEDYEDQGDIFLSFRHEDAILERKTIGHWKKEETTNPMSIESIKYKIIKEDGVCKIIENKND